MRNEDSLDETISPQFGEFVKGQQNDKMIFDYYAAFNNHLMVYLFHMITSNLSQEEKKQASELIISIWKNNALKKLETESETLKEQLPNLFAGINEEHKRNAESAIQEVEMIVRKVLTSI